MRAPLVVVLISGMAIAAAAGRAAGLPLASQIPDSAQQDDTIPPVGTVGEHVRIETQHGPVHLWYPDNYYARSAGLVVYIHGYFTNVDQTWTDDRLPEQFQASGRNALFVAIEAPTSNFEEVSWKLLDELLRTLADRAPVAMPHGPIVVMAHSGGFRTVLMWLHDPRVQYVILLDGLYAGLTDYRYWLRPRARSTPHHLVLVANETRWQSNQLARRTYGAARRRSVPSSASSFTARESRARLLYLTSQYDHMAIIGSGKVIPVLLQISPIKALPVMAEGVHVPPVSQ